MKISILLLVASAVGFVLHFHEIAQRVTRPFSGSTTQISGPKWLVDEPQARADAKAGNKFVLLRFTGSDWCGVCQAMDREALSTAEFKQIADENFVLVEIDFPRGKAQPAKLAEQNARLGQQYHVRGLPTVVVLDRNGEVVRQLGYRPGSPGMFLEELRTFQRADTRS